MEIKDFVSNLMFSRNQAHVFHLQTKSFAKHMALDSYYKDIVKLIDSLVETYQGTYGIIKVYSNNEKYEYAADTDTVIIPYFEKLRTFVLEGRKCFNNEDTDLLNILDEITSLIKSTLYKLKNLN